MSGARFLLLFIGDDEDIAGWLRLVDGVVVARGVDAGDVSLFPDDPGEVERIILVVPGVDVLLRWIDLPSLAPAQALAAARLMAADVSATPIDRLHVVLGGASAGMARCMAVADAERVARWIAAAQALGFDPDHILPEPLLILPPHEGKRRWERDGLHLLRGDKIALAAEPELAALAIDGIAEPIDGGDVEKGLGEAIGLMPVDLRQGDFAKRRRWRLDQALLRRFGATVAGICLVTLLVQAALILRYNLDADRLDLEAQVVALRALPRAGHVTDPSAQLSERLAGLRGGGLGFSVSTALFVGAVRDTPNVEIGSLKFDKGGSLRVTVLAPATADLAALERRLETRGLSVDGGEVRSGGGRQIIELAVTP